MHRLIQSLRIEVHPGLYVKDPESSDLGKRIVSQGILLIDELGFESFTFKKLGQRIGSNESSIYRYFENKHKFLLYLTSWYWGWMEYKLVFSTHSLPEPMQKLATAIQILSKATEEDGAFTHINEVVLNKIVINEFSKSYLTKEVDEENRNGYFGIYKRLIGRISELIREVKPDYAFSGALASTLLEGSLHQHLSKRALSAVDGMRFKYNPIRVFSQTYTQHFSLKQ